MTKSIGPSADSVLSRPSELELTVIVHDEKSEHLAWLNMQWNQVLKLDSDAKHDQNFFDLGGNSLASAELLFRVEEKYQCRLALGEFFREPTLATLIGLIREATTNQARGPGKGTPNTYGLIHKLQSFSGSWRGERQGSDSLLVGFHTRGDRPPVFWVCQEYIEAWQLAKYLGPDQPLYAMRSCVGIIPRRDYTADVLEIVCNRYLWEMLALPLDTPFLMGGNCQGGLFAFEMARRLKKVGRPPLLLVLLEWSYSYGSYDGPTLLIHGDESRLASVYREEEVQRFNWREDFPQSEVMSIPGEHGHAVKRDESVSCLASILRAQSSHRLNGKREEPTERSKLATRLARREMELREVLDELMEREAESKALKNVLQRRVRNLKNVEASTSWRITAPLRALGCRLGELLGRNTRGSEQHD